MCVCTCTCACALLLHFRAVNIVVTLQAAALRGRDRGSLQKVSVEDWVCRRIRLCSGHQREAVEQQSSCLLFGGGMGKEIVFP